VKSIEALRDELRHFADERDWQQFHNPKNLSMALSAEAAEVLEHFLWDSGEDSRALPDAKIDAVAEELADVLIYLVRLGDVLDVDLLDAAARKLHKNNARYPADKVRGRAVKYDEL
jgi:dCTP diphosphatase